MAKAVFFDLDGTLLDTAADIRDALNGALASFGYPAVTYGETLSYVGNGARRLAERAVPEGGDAEGVLAAFAKLYAGCRNEATRAYGGMAELLARLKQEGTKLAVITNKLQVSASRLIGKFYPALFDFVGGDDGTFPVKPDPSLTRYAALSMRVPLRDCVFVGDGETDVFTARNAGMVGVSVLWGYRTREQLAASGAQYFAEDVPALEKILKKFL